MLYFADIKPVVVIISPEICNRLIPTKNVTSSKICHQLSFAKRMTFYLQSVFMTVYLCLLDLVLTQECDKNKTYNWHLYSSKCFSTVLVLEPGQILPSTSECWGVTQMPDRLQPMGSWGPLQQNQVLFPARHTVRGGGESCRHTSSGLEAASPARGR